MKTRLVLVTGVIALLSAGSASAAALPGLRLVGKTALTGHAFRSHARVRLVFVANGRTTRYVNVRASGAFSIKLPAPFDRCLGLTVTATAAGQKVTLKIPRVQCSPAGQAATAQPSLALSSSDNALAGSNFPASATVRLNFGDSEQMVVTNSTGAFGAPLPPADRCSGLTVTAVVVSTGQKVTLSVPPKPLCAPDVSG
jgi:hypothetical protein